MRGRREGGQQGQKGGEVQGDRVEGRGRGRRVKGGGVDGT